MTNQTQIQDPDPQIKAKAPDPQIKATVKKLAESNPFFGDRQLEIITDALLSPRTAQAASKLLLDLSAKLGAELVKQEQEDYKNLAGQLLEGTVYLKSQYAPKKQEFKAVGGAS